MTEVRSNAEAGSPPLQLDKSDCDKSTKLQKPATLIKLKQHAALKMPIEVEED